jgi:hypothetical protein
MLLIVDCTVPAHFARMLKPYIRTVVSLCYSYTFLLLLQSYILATDDTENTPTISYMCEAVHRAYDKDTETRSRTRPDKPSTVATCIPWDADQYIKQLIEAPTGCTALPSLQLDVHTGLNSGTHLNKEGFIDNLSNTTQEFLAKRNLLVSNPIAN